jgi:hypothetical protein
LSLNILPHFTSLWEVGNGNSKNGLIYLHRHSLVLICKNKPQELVTRNIHFPLIIEPPEMAVVVDFKSLFNARFPSSLQTCQLRFQAQKLGVNFATQFASTFQCLNYCKQMFIVQVEINNSTERSWSSGLPRRFLFHWIGYYYWVWTFVIVYKRSSNIEMYLRTLLRSSRPISELGNVIGKFATNLGPARWKVT